LASQAGQQATQLLTMVVLARLLTPGDFGLVGMASVVIGFVSLFKDLGTSAAVIQSRKNTDELLSSVFWANVAFGCFSMIVIASAAPVAAIYFHEPRVSALLRVLSLSFAIASCSILQKAIFERKLMFRATAAAEVAGVAAGAAVGIVLALRGAGAWALVAQSLTSVSVSSALLWYLSDWRPQLSFHWLEIKRVSGYSLNLTGFTVVNYLARNTDYLLIGRFLGATQLGIYTLAYRIMLYPLQSISAVVSRVMFPVCSQLRDDDARFRAAYLRTVAMIALATFPMILGLYSVARPLVLTIFGAKWAAVIPLIQILTPVGLMQSIMTTVGTIYQAKGRTRTLFAWGLGSSLLTIVAFLAGLRWGVLGIAKSYAIVMLVLVVPCFVIPFRLIGLKLKALAAVLVRPLVASLTMSAVIAVVSAMLAQRYQVIAFQVFVVTGVIAYAVASWVVNRDQFRQVLALLGGRR
jgi:PST family polysaccharide transporter